jgi:hypothetical protein
MKMQQSFDALDHRAVADHDGLAECERIRREWSEWWVAGMHIIGPSGRSSPIAQPAQFAEIDDEFGRFDSLDLAHAIAPCSQQRKKAPIGDRGPGS